MLVTLQRLLIAACLSEDPPAALREALRDPRNDLTDAERAALARVGDDGLRLSSLLIKKLRFERLLAGDPGLIAEFEQDPAAFTARFRRYIREVPPTAVFPEEEAERYGVWHRTMAD